jgi:hypothetical protein
MLLLNAGTYLQECTDVKSQKILNLTRCYVDRTYVNYFQYSQRKRKIFCEVDFKQRCSYSGHDQLQNAGITTAQLYLQHSVKQWSAKS